MVRRSGSTALLAAATALSCSLLTAGGASAAPAAAAASGWGRVMAVPGLAALSQGGGDAVLSVSCWQSGDCVAVGSYTDAGHRGQAFLVTEKGGRWGQAAQVPGTAALNLGGSARANAISCAPGGDCALGGVYSDRAGRQQIFVASEQNGRWGRAEEVPGSARLNVGGLASFQTVSCARGGSCAAGGFYQGYNPPGTGYNASVAYVVSSKDGRWGKAQTVPGILALSAPGYPDTATDSVDCLRAGDCTAGGYYYGDGFGSVHAFVLSESGGHWAAHVVALKTTGSGVNAISCLSAGNCVAGGSGFLVTQTRGKWSKPLKGSGIPGVNSLSCPAAGDCTAGGLIGYDPSGQPEGAFILSSRHGRWRKVYDVPGVAAGGSISSLWCAAPGDCAAGGSYVAGIDNNGSGDLFYSAFVMSERNGRWTRSQVPAGLAALNAPDGNAGINAVSCGWPNHCLAGGSYTDAAGSSVAFLLSEP